MDFKLFAERVKEARKKAGLNQAELAERLGVGQNTVSNYENATGNKGSAPKLETAAKIAEVLNVSLDWLVGLGTSTNGASSVSDLDFISKLIDLLQDGRLRFLEENQASEIAICAGYNIKRERFWNFHIDAEKFLNAVEVLKDSGLSDEMMQVAVSGLKQRLLENYSDMLELFELPF